MTNAQTITKLKKMAIGHTTTMSGIVITRWTNKLWVVTLEKGARTMTASQEAAQEYLYRQNRRHHPDGEFDKAGRWYPSENEECKCCAKIRTPSRAYPYSLMTHCRSINHLSSLYGISKRDILNEVNKIR